MRHICTLLLLLTASAALAQPFVGAVCTDYVTGKFSSCESTPPWTANIDLATVHADAVVRAHAGLVYVVNRFGADNIQVLDPSQNFATILEASVGGGGNPQGIAFSEDGARAYVPRQERDDVLILDPADGAWLGSIDLSGWNDADGHCEPGDCIAVGNLLFVAIGRLDRNFYWSPVGDSYLAVVDMNTDTLVDVDPGQPGTQGIPLAATNPTWELGLAGDLIRVSCVGNYGLQDGGLELVDPVGLGSLGLAIDEAALGGDIGDVAWVSETLAYAIVSDASFNTLLKQFDPSTGGGVWTVSPGAGFVYTDMELDESGQLFLTDRAVGADGLRVYEADTGDALGHIIDMGLPPFDIVLPKTATATGEAPLPALRLRAWPNPFNPATRLHFEMSEPGAATVRVFDIRGREVDILDAGWLAAGSHAIVWRPGGLSSGVYLARVETALATEATRLVLVK